MWKLIGIISTLIVITGCSVFQHPQPNSSAFAPISPEKMKAPKKTTGGIYQAGYELSLFETIRARRIGDILTVLLIEKTDAEKKATTSHIKDDAVAVNNPTLFGQKIKLGNNNDFSFDIKGKRTFDGAGESKQNNKLEGSISVTVVDVMPNGNLVVRGEKWLTLNRGREYIRLSGIVRPADISPQNTVLSDRVANARIAYSGTGQVADSNRQGWLSRFFSTAFFPF